MFSWPISLRKQTRYIQPRGPGIHWAPRKTVRAFGVEFSVKVPRSSLNVAGESLSCRRRVAPHSSHFEAALTDNHKWERYSLISRRWNFNGPWFIGPLANLSMHISIVSLSKQESGTSMFNPRVFESAIADLMTYYHGEQLSRNGAEQDWFAPTGWQPLAGFPCIAAKFEAVGNSKLAYFWREKYCIFPLTDEHLLEIVLPVERNKVFIHSRTEPESDTNQWINEEPMLELSDQILNSLEIRLSDKAKQQQERAIEGLNVQERKLTERFSPLKWTTE